jgi:hypothetical protein
MPYTDCATCRGSGTVFHTTAIKGDDADDPCPDCGEITVDPGHPLWRDWDDDDWCGATTANWCNRMVKPGRHVLLAPWKSLDVDLLERVKIGLERMGAIVRVVPQERRP